MGERVLVIDDDDDLRALVGMLMRRAGLEPLEAADGHEGLRRLYAERPDVVVLDVSMPGLSGFDVLARIRELSDVPVLMLTASATEVEKVRGLSAGADDYVTKPFGNQELVARVKVLLRRAGARAAGGLPAPEVIGDDALSIDVPNRAVRVRGAEVALTPTEFRLLLTLARHPGQVLTHEQLLEAVWEGGWRSRDQVKLYVGYVRRKLQEAGAGDAIETVRGFGYRYRASAVSGANA